MMYLPRLQNTLGGPRISIDGLCIIWPRAGPFNDVPKYIYAMPQLFWIVDSGESVRCLTDTPWDTANQKLSRDSYKIYLLAEQGSGVEPVWLESCKAAISSTP